MVRIYRRIGSSPEVLGHDGTGRDMIAVGLLVEQARPDGSYAFDRLPEEAREWTIEQHAAFWQGLQERIRSGHVESFYPYRRRLRFPRDESLLPIGDVA